MRRFHGKGRVISVPIPKEVAEICRIRRHAPVSDIGAFKKPRHRVNYITRPGISYNNPVSPGFTQSFFHASIGTERNAVLVRYFLQIEHAGLIVFNRDAAELQLGRVKDDGWWEAIMRSSNSTFRAG